MECELLKLRGIRIPLIKKKIPTAIVPEKLYLRSCVTGSKWPPVLKMAKECPKITVIEAMRRMRSRLFSSLERISANTIVLVLFIDWPLFAVSLNYGIHLKVLLNRPIFVMLICLHANELWRSIRS